MPRISRPQVDWFILLLLAVVGLATLLPATGMAAVVLGWATKIVVGLLFFLYGARLSFGETMGGLRQWRLHVLVLAVTFIIFPLLGLGLHTLPDAVLSPELATGMLFLCVLPSTVQSSIAFTSIAKGNVSAAVVSASLSNVLGVVITPLLVLLLIGGVGGPQIDLRAMINIVAQLLLPFVLGQLAHKRLSPWLKRHAAPTKVVERGSILLVVYVAFSEGMNQHIWSRLSVADVAILIGLCCLLLAVLLGLTTLIGRVAGLNRADRIVLQFCGSKKSLASGLPMATILFAGPTAGLVILPLMIFHQIQLMVCAVLAQRWGRAADREHQPALRQAQGVM